MAAGNALFVVPLAFTISSADQTTLQPAVNLSQNTPSLTYLSPSATTAQITIVGGGQSIDTLALIGSNLVSADTVSIKVGATASALTSAAATVVPAYTGTAISAPYTTKTVYQFPSAIAFNYVQITLTSLSAKAFSAQRLVLGKAVTSQGIDYSAEQSWQDRSVGLSGPGWVGWQTFGTVPAWKVTCSFISNAAWRALWQPFFQQVGNNAPFLFVPNSADPHPQDVIFGTFDGTPGKGTVPGYDAWTADMQMVALAP